MKIVKYALKAIRLIDNFIVNNGFYLLIIGTLATSLLSHPDVAKYSGFTNKAPMFYFYGFVLIFIPIRMICSLYELIKPD